MLKVLKIPEIYCGCSGWYYSWNPELSLDWYVSNSGLNAIEVNASFYRFPFPNQVKAWARKGKQLKWVIKVNRLITHRFKFGQRALEIFRNFRELFEPLEKYIAFYLFQLPPSTTPNSAEKIASFLKHANLERKVAIEPRNLKWFTKEWLNWAKEKNITWVSVDCPDFPRDIYKTTNFVYVRMHGRTAWYAHDYSQEELKDVAKRILATEPKAAYVFFNNDHDMLNNAQQMYLILNRMAKRKKRLL
ncbi:MAG: DUF72 domain-containing protein [Candidatus Nanoarchaeia archaeon]